MSMEHAFIFTGYLEDVVLIKKKYFHTKENFFLWKGLSYHNYMIYWPGIDDTIPGTSTRLAKENHPISLNVEQGEEIAEDCIFIGGDSIVEVNWAHWFFEHILKIKALMLSGVDLSMPLIISERIPDRFLQWGEKLVQKELNWKKINVDLATNFKRVFVSSASFYRKENMTPAIWCEGFSHMKSLFQTYVNFKQKKISTKSEVIFISRETAKWRKAINENNLFDIAQKELGAIKVNMLDYDLEDQVSLIHNACVIILFGGADGPMSLFCNPRATVLEMIAPGHQAINCALAFCAINRGNYIRLDAKETVGPLLGPTHLDKNYIVEEKLYSTLIRNLKVLYKL